MKEKGKKGMGKKTIGKQKMGMKRNGEKGEKGKEGEEGMEERGWASRGSRDTKGRWGGRETRGITGKGTGRKGMGWGRKRTHMARKWKCMGHVGKASPHPAQLHFPSHSSPITQPHCQHSPQDHDPSPLTTPAPTAPRALQTGGRKARL